MFKMDGFEQLQNQLKQMEEASRELEGEQSVSLEELFTQTFMSKYTTFNSFEDFLSAGNFKAETNDEFEAIPENELDSHVSKTTEFEDWEDMLGTAGQQYALKKLGF